LRFALCSSHAFAKTYEEHRANLKKYGYQ